MIHQINKQIFLFLLLSYFLSCAQKRPINIPEEIFIKGYSQFNTYNHDKIFEDYFQDAVKAKNYLPKDFSKFGDIDYTDFLQKAIDSDNIIVMPDFPILINARGLHLRNNSKIFFPKNARLIMKPNSKDGYQALMINGIKNVEVFFPKIIGDSDKHLSKTGEWGMGILIKNAHNIKIINPQISKCWGDGIYIGADDIKVSSNILIENALLDSNRRNAISIISGNNVVIKNSLMANTIGTPPNFGIDLEPNNNSNILKDIKLSNNSTYNNKVGVGVVLDLLIGSIIQNINILIENHTDYNSETGVEFFVDRGYSKVSNSNLNGKISVNNLRTVNTGNAVILNKSKSVPNLNIYVSNITSRKDGKSTKSAESNNRIFNNAIRKGQKVIL